MIVIRLQDKFYLTSMEKFQRPPAKHAVSLSLSPFSLSPKHEVSLSLSHNLLGLFLSLKVRVRQPQRIHKNLGWEDKFEGVHLRGLKEIPPKCLGYSGLRFLARSSISLTWNV